VCAPCATGALVGHEIRELRQHLPSNVDARVAAIFRAGRPIKPEGSTVIQEDDEVFFLADARNITTVMSELRRLDSRPTRRLLIAGGGQHRPKLAATWRTATRSRSGEIPRPGTRDRGRTAELDRPGGRLRRRDLLREENIDQTDVYMALTNDDEANIFPPCWPSASAALACWR
jgi:trk system potassium uptake protein TrkA